MPRPRSRSVPRRSKSLRPSCNSPSTPVVQRSEISSCIAQRRLRTSGDDRTGDGLDQAIGVPFSSHTKAIIMFLLNVSYIKAPGEVEPHGKRTASGLHAI